MPNNFYSSSSDLQRRRTLRNNPTPAEYELWQYLRKRQVGGWKFRRQASLGQYIVDFWCPEARLVIEVDGNSHFTPEALAYDAQRTQWIERQNIRVIRFRNDEVHLDMTKVVRRICDVLETLSPLAMRRNHR